MKLEILLTRADEQSLQEILGRQTVRLLLTLKHKSINSKFLRELLMDIIGPYGLLLKKEYRYIIIDFLKPTEIFTLSQMLGIPKGQSDYYHEVKKKNFRRGTSEETTLFNFFELTPPEIEDTASFLEHEVSSVNYGLFPHQRETARKVIKMLNEEEPYRVLLHMPTGSGKTRTTMNIICEHLRLQEPSIVIWLANSEELCDQAAEEFKKAWKNLGNRDINIYKFWGNSKLNFRDIKDGLLVMGLPKTVRQLKSQGGIEVISHLSEKTSLIIMDEAHQAIAPTYKMVLDSLYYFTKESKLLGLSATPGRTWNDMGADEKLAAFFSRKKVKLEIKGYSNPVDYLTTEGYLAKVKYKNLFHQGKISTSELSEISKSIDIPERILIALGTDEQRNLKILYEVENLVIHHKRIIVFAPSVEASNTLATVLTARGHIAYSVTGESPPERRKKIINSFKDNEEQPKILCNYGVLSTGFDAPKTSAAIIARPTVSLVLYSQMIGRAIRGVKAGGNNEAQIITIVDSDLPGFRAVSEAFMNWEDVWE